MNYKAKLNKTVLDMKPSGIRKFFDIVASMPDCLSLGVGEPDFVTPKSIRQAAIDSINAGKTAYTSNLGLLELRKEVADYMSTRFNVKYDGSKEIIMTVGASEAIDLALRATVMNGDEVLMPDPSYVSYAPNVLLVGGRPKAIKTNAKSDFKLTPELLEKAITKKSKVLIMPYPNNPTGGIMTKDELAALVPIIIKHDLIVLSDEIYAELTYDEKHTSVASFKGMWERTILVSGFSKAFAMTGWRLGYACAPTEVMAAMTKIHQYVIMSAPTAAQYAALEALRDGKKNGYAEVVKMKNEYDRRRRYLIDSFRDMGLDCFEAKGAFYVFPCVASTGLDGEQFAEQLLMSEKVAVVPGSGFGDSGKNYVRTCYAASMDTIKEAVVRIRRFVDKLKK